MSRKTFFFLGAVVSEGDGHKRITKADGGVIIGGTQDEHEAHVERCLKANEVIRKNIDKDPKYIRAKINEVMGD